MLFARCDFCNIVSPGSWNREGCHCHYSCKKPLLYLIVQGHSSMPPGQDLLGRHWASPTWLFMEWYLCAAFPEAAGGLPDLGICVAESRKVTTE